MYQTKLIYYKIKAKLEFGIGWKVNTARYFLRLAYYALFKRLSVITSSVEKSKGDFRYFTITLSWLPVSSTHTYKEIGEKDE